MVSSWFLGSISAVGHTSRYDPCSQAPRSGSVNPSPLGATPLDVPPLDVLNIQVWLLLEVSGCCVIPFSLLRRICSAVAEVHLRCFDRRVSGFCDILMNSLYPISLPWWCDRLRLSDLSPDTGNCAEITRRNFARQS
jgi:hypothetical protein